MTKEIVDRCEKAKKEDGSAGGNVEETLEPAGL
jgi:hypothetical protein